MIRRSSPASLLIVPLALLVACAGDDARRHVYQSPPPGNHAANAAAPGPGPTAESPGVQAPIGRRGPSAQITSVRLVSTGAPAALAHVSESITVLALASRGRGSSPAGPARLELRLTGAVDTVLTVRLDGPVPLVISHEFTVEVGTASGLRDGAYQAVVRLLGPGGRMVAGSIPVHLEVRMGGQ